MELPNASKLFLFIQTNPESVCPIIDYSSHRLFNSDILVIKIILVIVIVSFLIIILVII